MNKGRFIVFEGLDGSGKTTALEGLKARLEAEHPVYMTREPSDGEVGRLIRRALTKEIVLQPKTFALLFAADRYEHLQNEVLPAVERGAYVICDRYYFSNLAYQGDVAPMEMILSFNEPSRTLIRPDIVFYIDTPAEECMRRIRAGRAAEELFEKTDKLRATQALYEKAFAALKEQENIVRIDGMLPPEQIVENLYANLQKMD